MKKLLMLVLLATGLNASQKLCNMYLNQANMYYEKSQYTTTKYMIIVYLNTSIQMHIDAKYACDKRYTSVLNKQIKLIEKLKRIYEK